MGELITPKKIHVITKEGECKLEITIDLNINLNTGVVDAKSVKTETETDDEKTIWAIPTFKSKDKVKFGKNKEQE